MTTTDLLPIEQATSRASYTIKIDGDKIPSEIRIHSLIITSEVNRIAAAYLSISDGDVAKQEWEVSSDTWFIPGNEIEIAGGYQGIDETIFKGIVTRHSIRIRQGQRELNIECREKAVLMTVAKNSKLFSDVKDSDIATTLLGEYSLTGTIEDTPITHAEIIQYDCTDWDFLISRLDAVGFIAITEKAKVNVSKPAIESTALATLRFGSNIIEFDAEIDGCRQLGAVKARAWDPANQELLEVEANAPAWTTIGDLDPADISSNSGATEYILRQPGKLTEQEVQQWADTKLLRSRMAFMCGRARVQGFSKAVPGITVAFEGLGNRINGMAWVSGIRHEFTRGNWLTDLQLGLSEKIHLEKFNENASTTDAMLPGINGLHTAIVTALEGDPDSESRIRIKIPSVDLEGEGSWARVATLDAGSSRGSMFLPEIDDEVVIGFLNDDPRQPIVLGALHSSAKATPIEAADDNHKKGFITRSGMRILFDDEKSILTIDTPGGNSIALDEDTGGIEMKDQNGNKLTMSPDGIKIESAKDLEIKASGSIKIESSMSLEAKAGTQAKLEGSAGMELKSSAVTVLKGSLVQIN